MALTPLRLQSWAILPAAALQQAFGADAAYEIYLGEGYSVEYPA